MSFCLPFAYYKEWQEAQQQQKEDLEAPLLAAAAPAVRKQPAITGWWVLGFVYVGRGGGVHIERNEAAGQVSCACEHLSRQDGRGQDWWL